MTGRITAVVLAGLTAFTASATSGTARTASAANLPNFRLGIQLADGGGRTELGVQQFTLQANFGTSASPWAGDANNFDPDVARISLNPAYGGGLLRPGLDFRIGGQARDNNGKELGTAVFSGWASEGGGPSATITDSNSFDPDQYRVFVETRPMPPGVEIHDFRFFVLAVDRGEADGAPAFTPWASLGGGQSEFARDANSFDPDGFQVGIEAV